ncbi:MAG: glycosyltransferase [Lutibacter sp.]
MILLDSLYINNSGGKILLDYLVEKLEKSELDVFYLFDKRCENDYQYVPKDRKTYLKASLLNRHKFYKDNRQRFSKVFCFGNLPPTLKLEVPVYTYFHQKLFLQIPKELPIKQKLVLTVKSKIFNLLIDNTHFWMVQTATVKKEFLNKFQNIVKERVIVLPFYPTFFDPLVSVNREKNSFVYVSNGSPHKNHLRLIEGFVKFYQKHQTGKLYVTIGNEFPIVQKLIAMYQEKGFPIINIGFLNRLELEKLYKKNEFLVFPSLTESFGLGLLEAMENGCKIIGADLPYTHAVCNPSLIFDPYNVESIAAAFYQGSTTNTKPTEQLIFNEIDNLITLLR